MCKMRLVISLLELTLSIAKEKKKNIKRALFLLSLVMWD